jgi:hypothetical protein
MDSFSGISVHPYLRRNPEPVANDYARLRQMIRTYRDERDGAELPIISGEWGYSSVWRGMDEEKQAVMLARQFLTNMANGIPLSIWYDWRDDGLDPKEAEHHFGLVRNQNQSGAEVNDPKAAYLAARTLTTVLKGFRFERRLEVGGPEDYALAFAKAGERRIVAWTVSPTPHRLLFPNLSGEFVVTTIDGVSGGRVAATNEGLRIDVSGSPRYFVAAN